MNDRWVQLAFIGSLLAIAIVALVISTVWASNNQERSGAVAVATACVAVLATIAGKVVKRNGEPPE